MCGVRLVFGASNAALPIYCLRKVKDVSCERKWLLVVFLNCSRTVLFELLLFVSAIRRLASCRADERRLAPKHTQQWCIALDSNDGHSKWPSEQIECRVAPPASVLAPKTRTLFSNCSAAGSMRPMLVCAKRGEQWSSLVLIARSCLCTQAQPSAFWRQSSSGSSRRVADGLAGHFVSRHGDKLM